MKIALTGKIASGKNTVADYLTENYGHIQFSFADEVKRLAIQLFAREFHNRKAKHREIYQWLGQTMRQRDPNVWIWMLDCKIREKLNCNDENIVITDLRLPNEYEYCRENGFVIIRVNCRDDIRRQRAIDRGDIFDDSMFEHETEQHIPSFEVDYEIDNSGRWIDMAEQVDIIIREINQKRMAESKTL